MRTGYLLCRMVFALAVGCVLCSATAQAATRMVVLPLDALECVRLLGGMDSVVGVTQHAATRAQLLPEVRDKASVGRGFSPNLEAIALLQPEVVVAWEGYPGPELERQLEPLGIGIVRLDLHLPHKLEAGVTLLAELLGGEAPARAAAFLAWNAAQESRLRALWQKQAQAQGTQTTVLAEHFAPERLAGPGSALFALTEKAGGRNLAAGLRSASTPVDAEWMVGQNPAVLIKSVSLTSEDAATAATQLAQARQEVLTRKGWSTTDAVRSERVHTVNSDILGGPRWVVGMATLVGLLYPEAAPEAQAHALHEEYLRLFQSGERGGGAGGPLAAP